MRRLSCLLLVLALLAGAAVLRAQRVPTFPTTAREEIHADSLLALGLYSVHPFHNLYPAAPPEGYRPFYVSHYGRHGSRYYGNSKLYDELHVLLEDAAEKDMLTATGRQLLARYRQVYPSLKGKGGLLSDRGEAEQRRLGILMGTRYPEVFSAGRTVDARSTMISRTRESMRCFGEGLQEVCPGILYRSSSEAFDQTALKGLTRSNPRVRPGDLENATDKDAPWKEDYTRFLKDNTEGTAFCSRFFKDMAFVRSYMKLYRFERKLYCLACDMPCLAFTEVGFLDFFTEEELYRLWRTENLRCYLTAGASDRYVGGRQWALKESVLRDMVDLAEADIRKPDAPVARLRFGHDHMLVSMLAILDVPGFNEAVSDPDSVEFVFRSWLVPMASNLQWVFYRRTEADPVLVRVLYNDRDLDLPLTAEAPPYYRWDTLRDWLRERIRLSVSLLDGHVKSTDILHARPSSGVTELFRREPRRMDGDYTLYDFDRVVTRPVPPKGFRPVYYSHYARHGSRHVAPGESYDLVWQPLKAAAAAGALTPKGRRLYAAMDTLYPLLAGRELELTRTGRLQHARHAREAVRRYPEIFRKKTAVEAYASVTSRTRESMEAYVESLEQALPGIRVKAEARPEDMRWLNPYHAPDFPLTDFEQTFKDTMGLWYPQWRAFSFSRIDADRVYARLFRGDSFVAPGKRLSFVMALQALGGVLNALDLPLVADECLRFEERMGLWEAKNLKFYMQKGAYPPHLGYPYARIWPLMEELLASAGKALAGRTPSARLRFGHDGCLMALLCLMGAEGWSDAETRPERVREVWRNDRMPMASQMEWVFYRNAKGRVLVHPLLNGTPLVLPVHEAAQGGFYDWEEFRTHCEKAARKARELYLSASSTALK